MADDQAQRGGKAVDGKDKLIPRLRRQYPWFDHLVRANDAFGERYGNHYAAAITYFSVLSLVPLLMIGFAVAAFVLAGDKELLDSLKTGITESAPEGLGTTLNTVVDQAIEERAAVGVLGLATALYSGIGWMSNLRDALTAQWGQPKQSPPLIKGLIVDLLALTGLGAALAVSFGLSAVGSGMSEKILDLFGLQGQPWTALLVLITIVLSLAANWLVFLWVITKLPRERVTLRSAMKGALMAAVGFEILKQVATIFLASVTSSPTGALFGPIIGLLVFSNLVSRFLLFVTAWTATAKENIVVKVAPPAPVVIRPAVQVRKGPSAGDVAGLLGIGGLIGVGLTMLRKRRD